MQVNPREAQRSMRLKTKSTVLTTGLFAAMILVMIPASLLAFRLFSVATAEDQVRSVAEVVRVTLTHSMVNNQMENREALLARLAEVQGLLEAHVVRSPSVIMQFGPGLDGERVMDAIEEQVLRTGRAHFGLVEEADEPVFRGTIPYIADQRGDPNCLGCHEVGGGTVLGAITISLSLSKLQRQALLTSSALTGILLLFAVTGALFFRGQVAPVALVANRVREVVAQAKGGDFRGRVECQSNDEMGEISRDLNWLMTYLQESLGNISQEVARLIRYDLKGNTNLLITTTEMVDALVDVAQFKQAVEEDQTRREVYQRIARILQSQFGVRQFTIYEVAASKNRMKAMVVDGDGDGACRWCDPQVLLQADACRAQRTGHIIDGMAEPTLCGMFHEQARRDELGHICLPVMHSGSVGSVVQIVGELQHGRMFQLLLPFILVYLRESAPVVQAKRLMDTLRESALRDPLTSLHNRRFMEEYGETLVATAKRKQGRLTVLMVDMDHFKSVNDAYGHEAGDLVLKALSKILTDSVRTSDLVIRYGGEEFLIVLQENEGSNGPAIAEKIRRSTAEAKIQVPGAILQKTLSIGVARFPADSPDFWEVVRLADAALYQAKERGRNRVVIHPGASGGAGETGAGETGETGSEEVGARDSETTPPRT